MRLRRPSSFRLRLLALGVALLAPFVVHGQADKAATKKYLKEMATLYESLAITEVEMPQAVFQATDIFRASFKIANQADRTLAVPLKPGLPADAACIVGQPIFSIRRVSGSMGKREPPRVYVGFIGSTLASAIEPKALLIVRPPLSGQMIKSLALTTGDYELTMDFGIHNGPKVKSVIRKFRVENSTSPSELAKERAAWSNSSRQSFVEFAQSIFAAVKPGELTLSKAESRAGAPLQASYVIEKADGRELPSLDGQNRPFALGYTFRLHKPGAQKYGPPIWSKEIVLTWDSLAILRDRGSFTMSVTLETVGLAPGPYELSVEALHAEGITNAPRLLKERFVIVK